ncbi:hypothetical protein M153_14069000139 [Pseudoloma neurophilia]|uniref:Uncharacterized protein n=1 Tax=Pseudoloma neurophilia TaxID=146866 RepID=A0A0R0LVS2_9MICR|nr:hypothetical protein M153_14069000139 [Pseudoloma neurophilia]
MLFQFLILFSYNFIFAQSDDSKPVKPNPSKEDEDNSNTCKTYDIKIADEYKSLKGIKAADTEVFKEAKANGLVPIQVITTFASPSAVNLGGKLPDSLKKVFLVIQENNKNNVAFEEGQTYSFVGGEIVDALDKESGDKEKENDKNKEQPNKDKSSAAVEPETQTQAPKLKASPKLVSRPQSKPAINLRDQEEASDSLGMQKDE